MSLGLAALALAAWLYLLLARGFYWLPRLVPPQPQRQPERWPSVAVIVPARNEAEHVGAAISSLRQQDYAGPFSVVLVDDHSTDGTAEIARRAAAGGAVEIVAARPLPPRWSGKLWALSEGVRQVEARAPDLLFFTDADIVHAPATVRQLVSWLEAERRALVSLMVLLRAKSLAERLLIPAFVYFFAMLYPFAWAADPAKRTAAAAGGAILVRRDAFLASGGFEAIKGELIDDCALARRIKPHGSIALALTRDSHSLRAYPRLGDVTAMVARTAYTQLNHSPLLLVGTVLGLGAVFLAPPALLLARGAAAGLGAAAWAAMAVSYLPMLRFYRLSPLWAPLLPLVAVLYLAATVQSAVWHYQGSGGAWKGRVQWQSQR